MNPRAPRVVHLSPALFGAGGLVGGGERYALELARAMAGRIPTTLLSFGRTARTEMLGPLKIEVLANWAPFGRFQVDPINPAVLARLRQADVVHAHQSFTTMTSLALLYARATGRPIFTTHHGGGGVGLNDLTDIKGWFSGHLHVSRFSREALGHAGLATAEVIYGGGDAERFRPDPQARRTGEVLFVGRALPHKGANYLIEAVDAATPLTVIGAPWWRGHDAYQALLARLAEGKDVRMITRCDDLELTAAYQRALCIVLPSVYTTVSGERYRMPELLGQTLLEGMACGLPAICTDVGGMPEVVQDGVTGFVVAPNDPAALRARIAWLKANPDAAAKMGRAGRQRVLERFSWSGVVDRCMDAYRAALARQTRAASAVQACGGMASRSPHAL